MSDTHGSARRRVTTASIGTLSAALIISGVLVAADVGTTSPLPIAIGVIGWMGTTMVAGAWMARGLLHLSRTLAHVNRELVAQSEEARRHREQLNAELKEALAGATHDLKLHAIMWLLEHQGQVQEEANHAHAIQHALGLADQRASCQPDELAERRAAR